MDPVGRDECLDRLLIMGEGHWRGVMKEDITDDNEARPHQAIEQRCPIPLKESRQAGTVKSRDGLGGVIHDYDREAA